MIRNEPTYILLDDQQVVFNTILAKVRARQLSQQRSTIIGCAVYFRDEPTRDFVLSRIDSSKL